MTVPRSDAARPGAAEPPPVVSDDNPLPIAEREPAPEGDSFVRVGVTGTVWAKFKGVAANARVLPDFTLRQEVRIQEEPHHYVDIGHVAVSAGLRLYTNGLWPCVAVVVINTATQRALLMHASSADEVPLLRNALGGLGKGILEEKKIPLAGYRPNYGMDSLAVDPMTGRVY